MRYGTIPLARRTGGLADTIVDVSSETLKDNSATGFLFSEPNSWRVGEALTRALGMFKSDPKTWEKLQLQAMSQHFTWERSAKQYVALYKSLMEK
jgi:starch synthase